MNGGLAPKPRNSIASRAGAGRPLSVSMPAIASLASRSMASLATAAVALLVLLAGGCGYSTGLALPERARTIGVEIFGNDSLERDLEPLLYDEISRAVRDWADAPLVAPERADVVVRGKITSYHRRAGVRNPQNELLETAIYIDVDASLYRAGGDRPIRGPVHLSSSTGYLVPLPDSVSAVHDRSVFENESVARDRTLRNIADKLVLDLLAPVN
jgi:hypothetical protein